jgi:hypothetical protein
MLQKYNESEYIVDPSSDNVFEPSSQQQQQQQHKNLVDEQPSNAEDEDEEAAEVVKILNEDEAEEEALAEAWETIRNFVPKRPIVPSPLYPDLSLANEKDLRSRVGGSSQWQMPFRHSLFEALAVTKQETR